MPSPIAHALAGVAAGWACAPPPRGRPGWSVVAGYAAAGMSPDLDLLVHAHSGPTHGLGAALLLGVGVLAVAARRGWPPSPDARRMALALAAAYGTHTLLDWLGTDSSPPIGIMALWPFSRDHYESSLHVFMAISRRYWLPEFWGHNLRALVRELAILLPLAGGVIWLRRRP